MPTQTAERAFMDAYVRADARTRNTGGLAGLHVLGGASSTQRITYLQVQPPCPAKATVVSAKLRLFQASASGGSRTLSLRRVTEKKWLEKTITWNNRPARTATVTGEPVTLAGAGEVGRMVEFDVTADVQAWVGGAVNYGWTLESSADNLVVFYGKDASSRRPQLLVEWSMAPDRPTDTQPAGGLYATVPKATLRWSYNDQGSLQQPLAAARVHLATANTGWSIDTGYAAPTFDTGAVPLTIAQLALAATAWAGLTSGQRIWYSLQHQDGSGVWSKWSDPQQFGYAVPASVTVTSPVDTIADTAFPVAWDTPSQARYQVLVTDPATGAVLYDTGEVPSTTARSVMVPRGVVTRAGQKVRRTVRVWDAFARVDVPGAPAYAQASAVVTYTDSTAVAPVTQLDVIASSQRPTAQMSWRRTGPVAQFGIWVDDVEVEVVDAATVAVPGQAGQFLHHLALPTSQQVTVKAIESTTIGGLQQTRASAKNTRLDVDYELFAVWLIVPDDPDRDIRFLQEDDDIVDTDMPEVTSVFEPAGSPVGVHVTSVLRWFTGTLSGGILADYGDLDADTLRERMLRAKGDRLRTYTLMWGRRAVPVWIREVNVVDDFIPGAPRYVVSFAFSAAVPSPEYELQ